MLLSFIIPLYNCGRYISACLDAIYAANVDDASFEVIIVNDGSSDDSCQKVEEYVGRGHHANLHLLSQPNRGASAARNLGIDNAQGEYIWFVDADDKVDAAFFGMVVDVLKGADYDIVCFNHRKVYEHSDVECRDYAERTVVNGTWYYQHRPSGFLWNKIYRRTALRGEHFVDGTKNIEDFYFNSKTTLFASKMLLLPDIGYDYNNTNPNSTSSSKSRRNLVKLHHDTMLIHALLADDVKNMADEAKRNALRNELDISVAGCLFSLMRFYSQRWLFRAIDDYRRMGLYPIGYTNNRRANVFITLMNHPWLVRIFYALHRKK